MYSPYGTNVYGARGGEFEVMWSVYRVCLLQNRVLRGTSYSLVQTFCCTMYRLVTIHKVTDKRQTVGHTDNSIMPIADHTARSTIG